MSIKRYEQSPRMSRAVIHNDVLYLCGQVAKDYTEDIKDQTKKTLQRVEDLLLSYGSDKDSILTAQIFLARREDINGMNQIWIDWINEENAPARATVCVDFPNPDILVEIVVTAVVNK